MYLMFFYFKIIALVYIDIKPLLFSFQFPSQIFLLYNIPSNITHPYVYNIINPPQKTHSSPNLISLFLLFNISIKLFFFFGPLGISRTFFPAPPCNDKLIRPAVMGLGGYSNRVTMGLSLFRKSNANIGRSLSGAGGTCAPPSRYSEPRTCVSLRVESLQVGGGGGVGKREEKSEFV